MLDKALDRHDAGLGALLGACVGDAAGATLEFIGRQPRESDVEWALGMPGGGVWGVAPGQITDDGELTLCLAQALAGAGEFNLELIAQSYAGWIRSNPFDIGTTTRNSLGCFLSYEWKTICEREGYAAGMTQAAFARCMASKANGSLMRASPLGIWGRQLETQALAACAIADSGLSHPNTSCCHAVACYALAIGHLVARPGDVAGAFERVQGWAARHATQEVQGWLQDARQNIVVPYHPQAGFIRIGFTHAFRHLQLGTSYVEALRETLAGGGDTDTNACIVGGLIGAACGAAQIPQPLREAVLSCDTKRGKHARPEFLQAQRIPALVDQLVGR